MTQTLELLQGEVESMQSRIDIDASTIAQQQAEIARLREDNGALEALREDMRDQRDRLQLKVNDLQRWKQENETLLATERAGHEATKVEVAQLREELTEVAAPAVEYWRAACMTERAAHEATKAESESRRKTLFLKAEELAAEWRRAEAAEARVAELAAAHEATKAELARHAEAEQERPRVLLIQDIAAAEARVAELEAHCAQEVKDREIAETDQCDAEIRARAAKTRVEELKRELDTEKAARGQDIRSMSRTIEQLNMDLERNKRLKLEAAVDRDKAEAALSSARELLERQLHVIDLVRQRPIGAPMLQRTLQEWRAIYDWLRAHPKTATPAATGGGAGPMPFMQSYATASGRPLRMVYARREGAGNVSDDQFNAAFRLLCEMPNVKELSIGVIMAAVHRAGLALVPGADLQPISDETLRHLRECALAWEPEARVIGDVTAHQLRALCLELARLRADVPTPEERTVLEACANAEITPCTKIFKGRSEWAIVKAELARRAGKKANGG